MRIRYGRWSGTQEPLGHDVSAGQVLDELSDDLLAGVDPERALRDLLRRGLSAGMSGRTAGLAELRRRVAEARRREAERMGVDGPLQELGEALQRIVDLERAALDLAGDDVLDAAERAERHMELDTLPDQPAQRIAALSEYDFHDARAAEEFAQLVERVRRDVAEATFGRLAQALGEATPNDLARTRELLADLNDLIEARERGEDITAGWEAFRQRHAEALASLGDPETLDELLEELARRMAAMSALMAGMTAEQRRQLSDLSAQLMGDAELAFQAERLRRLLQRQLPQLGWDQPVGPPGSAQPGTAQPDVPGQGEGGVAGAVDWVQRVRDLEDLEQALGQDYPGARLEDVDSDRLRELLGEDAAADVAALRRIERLLEEAGALVRSSGRLELTPRGVRRLGEHSLLRIFDRAVEGAVGGHRTPSAGGAGEPTGSTRPLAFGDPFRLDVGRTLGNALRRGRPEGGTDRRVRLEPGDFELAEAERRVRAVTVLLLDMSFSMPLRGNWETAKRVALALQALVASRFPEDDLHVVGFSDYARRLGPRDLLVSGWERVYGTNMQHAFIVARRLLDAHPGAERQVVMITDGEPTAHLDGEHAIFAWPPEPRTLALTMREARRLARSSTTLNVFLLDHDPGAAAFVERMVASVGGRILYPDLADLGRVVVRDFLSRRAPW